MGDTRPNSSINSKGEFVTGKYHETKNRLPEIISKQKEMLFMEDFP